MSVAPSKGRILETSRIPPRYRSPITNGCPGSLAFGGTSRFAWNAIHRACPNSVSLGSQSRTVQQLLQWTRASRSAKDPSLSEHSSMGSSGEADSSLHVTNRESIESRQCGCGLGHDPICCRTATVLLVAPRPTLQHGMPLAGKIAECGFAGRRMDRCPLCARLDWLAILGELRCGLGEVYQIRN